jgi:hypothetical protein
VEGDHLAEPFNCFCSAGKVNNVAWIKRSLTGYWLNNLPANEEEKYVSEKITTIIAVSLLTFRIGILPVKAQDTTKEIANNAEENMAKMNALAVEQMSTNGQLRIVARLGI